MRSKRAAGKRAAGKRAASCNQTSNVVQALKRAYSHPSGEATTDSSKSPATKSVLQQNNSRDFLQVYSGLLYISVKKMPLDRVMHGDISHE
jgi:hypothetical protein